MNSLTQITRVSAISLAKAFAAYYAFWGLVFALFDVFSQHNSFFAPLGFWTLFLAARLNFTFHAADNVVSRIGFAFWVVPLYAATGWCTGLVGALIYNGCAKYFGFYVKGISTPEEGSK